MPPPVTCGGSCGHAAAWRERCSCAVTWSSRPCCWRTRSGGFRQLGDAWGVAGCVDLLGSIAHQLGDHPRATALARESVEQHRSFDDSSGTRYALQHLAEAALATDDL